MSPAPSLTLRPLTQDEQGLLACGIAAYRQALAEMARHAGMRAYAHERTADLDGGEQAVAAATGPVKLHEPGARALRLALDRAVLNLIREGLPAPDVPLPEPLASVVRLCLDLDEAARAAGLEWD